MEQNVSNSKRELFRKLLIEKKLKNSETPPEIINSKTLSPAQLRMWLLQERNPQDTSLNICSAFELTGDLDTNKFRESIEKIIERHDVLHTNYILNSNKIPELQIRTEENILWQFNSIIDENETFKQQYITQMINNIFNQPFNLAKDPLIRIGLFKLEPQKFIFIFVTHHICWDDDSWIIFFSELNNLYSGKKITKLLTQYTQIDFTLESKKSKQQLDYWLNNLLPLVKPVELFSQSFINPNYSIKTSTIFSQISLNLLNKLNILAKDNKATVFMTLLAGFSALIYKHSHAKEFLVSLPVINRDSDAAKSLIGYFGNIIILKLSGSNSATFLSLLNDVKTQCFNGFANQQVGIDKIASTVNAKLNESDSNKLLDLLGFSFTARQDAGLVNLTDIISTELSFRNDYAQNPLGITIVFNNSGARVELKYSENYISHPLAKNFINQYITILDKLVTNPTTELKNIILNSKTKINSILKKSSGTLLESNPKTLTELLDTAFKKYCNNIALVTETNEYTYKELQTQVNRFANWLTQHGISRESIVAIKLTNSREYIISVLGVLQAGGVFVPIDPANPVSRIEYYISDVKPQLIIDESLFNQIEAETRSSTIKTKILFNEISPHNLAYVIYTSGSTGKPKGVAVEHLAIAEHVEGIIATRLLKKYQITKFNIIQSTTVSFDAALFEIFVGLVSGGKLVIPKPKCFTDTKYLNQLILQNSINILHLSPAVLDTLVSVPEFKNWKQIEILAVGGEALKINTVNKVLNIFSTNVINNYGPTETVVSASSLATNNFLNSNISTNSFVPIGQPNPNTYIYVLDEDFQLVADNVPGEIYIGGNQLARGYYENPKLTAQRFIANPYPPGGRLYRTGDLGYRDYEGNIVFLGRKDEQVKIRGFRIELNEILSIILAHQNIQNAIVEVWEPESINSGGVNKYLIAYVVVKKNIKDFENELINYLRSKLPDYMVPSRIIILKDIPLNLSGKVDKKLLPKPDLTPKNSDFNSPKTDLEKQLTKIYQKLTNLKDISIDDSFFDLGGNSLLVIKLIASIKKELHIDIDVSEAFDYPTVRTLAKIITAKKNSNILTKPEILHNQINNKNTNLSYSQLAIWYQSVTQNNNYISNIPLAVAVEGKLDIKALTLALNDVINQHEVLRTIFPYQNEVPYRKILPPSVYKLEKIKINKFNEKKSFKEYLKVDAQYKFDITSELLIKAKLYEIHSKYYILSIVIHHLIFDHWSFNTFLSDLINAYQTRIKSNKKALLVKNKISYSDYVVWQKDNYENLSNLDEANTYGKQELIFWKENLREIKTQLDLPTDYQRPKILGREGIAVEFEIDTNLSEAIRNLANKYRVSEFMIYQTVVVILLYKFGAGKDIVLGTPIAARTDPALANLIGLFANIIILRNKLADDSTLLELLLSVRNTTLNAYQHQEVPLSRIVEIINPVRSNSRNPLFQIMLNFRENEAYPDILYKDSTNVTKLTMLPLDFDIAYLDLSFNFIKLNSGRILGSVVANQDLYHEATVKLFTNSLLQILQQFEKNIDIKLVDFNFITHTQQQVILTKTPVPQSRINKDFNIYSILKNLSSSKTALKFSDESITYEELIIAVEEKINSSTEIKLTHYEVTSNFSFKILVEVIYHLYSGDDFVFPAKNVVMPAKTILANVFDYLSKNNSQKGITLLALPWESMDSLIELLVAILRKETLIFIDTNKGNSVNLADIILKNNVNRMISNPNILSKLTYAGISTLSSITRWDIYESWYIASELDLFLVALAADSTRNYYGSIPEISGKILKTNLIKNNEIESFMKADFYVLDNSLRLVPMGVVGDLYISSANLSTGYFHAPQTSSTSFVANPFNSKLADRFFNTRLKAYRNAKNNLIVLLTNKQTSDVANFSETITNKNGEVNNLEAQILSILIELLEIPNIKATDNFFSIGGDSIIAVQLALKLKNLGYDLTPQMIFTYPTIKDLAQNINPLADNTETISKQVIDTVDSQPELSELDLTPLQSGLFSLSKLAENDIDIYTMQFIVKVVGEIDLNILRKSIAALLVRYPNLRAAFSDNGTSKPIQSIPESVNLPWFEYDIEINDFEKIVAAEKEKKFNLSKPPALRVVVVKSPPNDIRIIITIHHILMDGWSLGLFFKEMVILYHAQADLNVLAPVRPFSDYLKWLKNYDFEFAKKSWLKYLEKLTSPLILAEKNFNNIVTTKPKHYRTSLTGETFIILKNWARKHNLTLSSILMFTWAVLLRQLTLRKDVVFGATVSGRPANLLGADNMVGLFINTIPVVHDFNLQTSIVNQCKILQQKLVELQDISFVSLADIQRDYGKGNIFDTLFVFENAPIKDAAEFLSSDKKTKFIPITMESLSHYPLTGLAYLSNDSLEIQVEVYESKLPNISASKLCERLVYLLEQIPINENISPEELTIILPPEKSIINKNTYHEDKTIKSNQQNILDYFQTQVKTTPYATAIATKNLNYSYHELSKKINILAQKLSNFAFPPESRIAIFLPRSVEYVVAMLAIMQTGSAYVPIDINTPTDYINAVLTQSQPSLIIIDDSNQNKLSDCSFITEILNINQIDFSKNVVKPYNSAETKIYSSQLAYLIYTSGTTGKPKGVMGTHGALTSYFMDHKQRVYDNVVTRLKRKLNIAHIWSFSFDAAWQPLMGLFAGHTVHLFTLEEIQDSIQLLKGIKKHKIDMLDTTPSMFQQLNRMGLLDFEKDNSIVIPILALGGEAISESLWNKLSNLSETRVFNCYGPTETTVEAVVASVNETKLPVIGYPTLGSGVQILDDRLKPVLIGVIGELYISGSQLTRGYFNNPALTATRFIANPYISGEQMYRTGDLAYFTENGNVVYQGRIDDQIKIRGYRVELKLIEAELMQIAEITSATVIPIKKSNSTTLVAILTGENKTNSYIRSKLLKKLPGYMVPAKIVFLDELPLTVNGKVNLKLLKTKAEQVLLAENSVELNKNLPNSTTEKILHKIFSQILNQKSIDVNSDYFELGIDSILAISIVNQAINQGLNINPRMIFSANSIRELSEKIDSYSEKDISTTELDTFGSVTVAPRVQRVYQYGNFRRFVQGIFIKIPPQVNFEILQTVLQNLIDSQELLRTTLHKTSEGFDLVIKPPGSTKVVDNIHTLTINNFNFLSDFDIKSDVLNLIDKIDPNSGIMWQGLVLSDTAGSPRILLFVIHHLVMDLVSWPIILADLTKYTTAYFNHTSVRNSRRITYSDWMQALYEKANNKNILNQTDYWNKQLIPANALIGKRRVNPHLDTWGSLNMVEVNISESLSTMMVKKHVHNSKIRNILLTALVIAVQSLYLKKNYKTNRGVSIAIEDNGRDIDLLDTTFDTSQLIGWFTNVFPVRLGQGKNWYDLNSIQKTPNLGIKLFNSIQLHMDTIPNQGIGYSLLKYVTKSPELVSAPEPQIVFNFLGQTFMPIALDAAAAKLWTPELNSRLLQQLPFCPEPELPLQFGINITTMLKNDSGRNQILSNWLYSTNIISKSTIEYLAKQWKLAVSVLSNLI